MTTDFLREVSPHIYHSKIDRVSEQFNRYTDGGNSPFPRIALTTENIGRLNPWNSEGTNTFNMGEDELIVLGNRSGKELRCVLVTKSELNSTIHRRPFLPRDFGREVSQIKLQGNRKSTVHSGLFVIGWINPAGQVEGYIPFRQMQCFKFVV